MKKFKMLGIFLCLLLNLVACSKGNDDDDTDPPSVTKVDSKCQSLIQIEACYVKLLETRATDPEFKIRSGLEANYNLGSVLLDGAKQYEPTTPYTSFDSDDAFLDLIYDFEWSVSDAANYQFGALGTFEAITGSVKWASQQSEIKKLRYKLKLGETKRWKVADLQQLANVALPADKNGNQIVYDLYTARVTFEIQAIQSNGDAVDLGGKLSSLDAFVGGTYQTNQSSSAAGGAILSSKNFVGIGYNIRAVKLPRPQNLKGVYIANNKTLSLSWDNVGGAERYGVYIASQSFANGPKYTFKTSPKNSYDYLIPATETAQTLYVCVTALAGANSQDFSLCSPEISTGVTSTVIVPSARLYTVDYTITANQTKSDGTSWDSFPFHAPELGGTFKFGLVSYSFSGNEDSYSYVGRLTDVSLTTNDLIEINVIDIDLQNNDTLGNASAVFTGQSLTLDLKQGQAVLKFAAQ